MQTYNHLFSSQKRLDFFLNENGIQKEKKYFIQIFIGDNNPDKLQNLLNIIKQLLPLSCIIASSTAGEIIEGGMQENTTVISISSFKATDVTTHLIEANSEEEISIKILSLLNSQTKLLLIFNNIYAKDGEVLLNALEQKLPNTITIAGGNAGDNGELTGSSIVATEKGISKTAVAIALFNSDILHVYNQYLFNWQTIGEPLCVTKADKSTIYEINHIKTQDIYRQYLGNGVADTLPTSAIEFPLMFCEDGIEIARAPIAIGKDGELIMAGHIKEGSIVKFGYCDIIENDKNVQVTLQEYSKNPIESIFIYSCSARKYFFNEHLNNEFKMLQEIAPTSGFITYGEFYKHNNSNKVLNVSSTFIGLSEDTSLIHNVNFQNIYHSQLTKTLHALTHLVKHTSRHIEEKNNDLAQFQHLIKEATLYSTTDTRGIITDVNTLFVKLSGYTREELIGSNHNIVRHLDMDKQIYADMWQTIKNKQNWQGIIKNRAKDGSTYYVRSHIFPILNTRNKIMKYLSLRDDITEEMQRKNNLEGSVNLLKEKTKEAQYFLNQYEKVIDASSFFLRINAQYEILYANNLFCKIYTIANKEIRGKNILEFLKPIFVQKEIQSISEILQKQNYWRGTIPFVDNNKQIIYMNTSANAIFNTREKLVEIMLVMHDITDIILAKKEIEEVQKDVVLTMGAIGETRSRETGNHVKRVAEYSKLLAIHAGIVPKRVELLKMASPMHDIGKVGIPDNILNKPGSLTPDEWKIMKTHSFLGFSMLRHSKRKILKTAAIIAYTHHEKWDGSGYPNAIKGRKIHIFGRITALADVFDALGSDRCYKKAWDDEKIFKLIKEERGKHFDPSLVDIFFNKLDLFLKIRNDFKD